MIDPQAHRHQNQIYFSQYFQHERMLSDTVRVESYREAIRRVVKSEHRVLDLGTGTGILAQAAAEQGARVWAIDHSPIIEIAKLRYGHERITFLQTHSDSFHEPVDLIIHEQFGAYCFNEGLLNTVSDVRDRCLSPSGIILPQSVSLFLVPVQVHPTCIIPYLKEYPGFEFVGDSANFRIVHPLLIHPLQESQVLLTVDFSTFKPSELPQRLKRQFDFLTPTPIDGWGLFFRVNLCDGVAFDTFPRDQQIRHWNTPFWQTQMTLARGTVIWECPDFIDWSTWRIRVEPCG